MPHWLDIIITVILAFNLFRGFRQGLIKMVFGLVGLVLATLFAIQHVAGASTAVNKSLQSFVQIDMPVWLLTGGTFLAIWISVYFLVFFMGKLLSKALHLTPVGFLDTFGGLALGLVKGIIIVLMLVIPFTTMPIINEFFAEKTRDSLFLQWYQPVVDWGQLMLENYWPSDLIEPGKDFFLSESKGIAI